MSKLTRRNILGAGGGLLGLAACDTDYMPKPEARVVISSDVRPGYPGTVSFDHGVASGDPLPTKVIIWTRVTPDGAYPGQAIPVSYGLFTDKNLTEPVVYSEGFAIAVRDYTVKIDVGGLRPDTVYYYRFIAKTTAGQVISQTGRTKTTAASGDAPVRLAVMSCSNYPFGLFNVYKAVSEDENLDAIVHLGDYLYEYGLDGYGGSTGKAIGRNHEPPLEIITLGDYRTRHAQYKTDKKLQAAHAAAPWICTWDDHESANNAYRTGAQNHNPENNEGNWTDRKQAAVIAYLEWMPVRDPVVGEPREALYRRFDFGSVASIMCLETRLTGRSEEISWFTEIGGLAAKDIPVAAVKTMTKVKDPARTMLGRAQEDWLDRQLKDSAPKTAWQVLANQTIMAKVRPPNLNANLTDAQKSAQTVGYVKQLIPFSQLGLPWNLDAWDGFPAARDRLYASAKAANARLVTLTGDTHTAWANTLHDKDGQQRGVEFGCTSVTSPGFGTYIKDVPDIGDQFASANTDVEWYDPNGNGWTLVTLSKDSVRADYQKISSIRDENFSTQQVATFSASRNADGLSPLKRDA